MIFVLNGSVRGQDNRGYTVMVQQGLKDLTYVTITILCILTIFQLA